VRLYSSGQTSVDQHHWAGTTHLDPHPWLNECAPARRYEVVLSNDQAQIIQKLPYGGATRANLPCSAINDECNRRQPTCIVCSGTPDDHQEHHSENQTRRRQSMRQRGEQIPSSIPHGHPLLCQPDPS
jgi:hypothetical protein